VIITNNVYHYHNADQMLTNVRACMHGHTHAIMYLAAVIVKHNTETVTVLTAQWLDSADDTFHR